MSVDFWEDDYEDYNEGQDCTSESDDGFTNEDDSFHSEDDPDYTIIDMQDVSNIVREIAAKIAPIIGLDPSPTRLLLQHYKFNEEQLLMEFTSETDIEVLFAEHIHLDCTDSLNFNTYEGECEICCEEDVTLKSFKCGHAFCEDCWNSYLENEIVTLGNIFISCQQPLCNVKLDDEQVRKLLSKEDVKNKYNYLLAKAQVDGNKKLRWCKGNNCNKIIKLPISLKPLSVYCDCGENFCPACNEIAHLPLTCDKFKEWFKDRKMENDTYLWLKEHARPCPKCGIPIEKTGGCNFMQCTSPTCKVPFCWGCMQVLWRSHAEHNCFVFKNDEYQNNPEILDMNRFTHYYERFILHRTSEEFESTMKYNVETCCEKMHNNGFPTGNIKSFVMAYHELLKCRRVLAYSNAFSYYLKDESNRLILEDNVEHLASRTEKLAELFEPESPIWCSNMATVKEYLITMIECYSHMKDCRIKLLEHCDECVDNDYC